MNTYFNLKVAEQRVKTNFDPFRIVTDEEFGRNMNSIIAYYQIAKGEGKHRFTSTSGSKYSSLVLA